MYRFGIIGAGTIGREHRGVLRLHPECQMTAVCDLDIEKAKKLAEDTDAAVYTDYKEMCEKEELDAVIINLPHFLHKDAAVYFLDHHIPTLVEKPMAISVEECNAMIEASKRNDTVLGIGHVQRFYDHVRIVKKIIESGELGELTMIREYRGKDYSTNRPQWFLDIEKSGGGITVNYGAHALDQIFYSSGLLPVKVFAVGDNKRNDNTVEANGQILMQLSNGAGVNLSFCDEPIQGDPWESCYHFTKGRIVRHGAFEVTIIRGAEEPEVLDAKPAEPVFLRQLSEFVKMMKGEPNDMPTGEYSREIIRVLESSIKQFDL